MGYLCAFIREDFAPSGVDDADSASISVVIQIGNQVFTGDTSGPVDVVGDWRGGYILANNKKFRKAIEKNDTLTIFPDRPYTVELDIKGANNAIFEIRKCT